jgi:hypothetical protein
MRLAFLEVGSTIDTLLTHIGFVISTIAPWGCVWVGLTCFLTMLIPSTVTLFSRRMGSGNLTGLTLVLTAAYDNSVALFEAYLVSLGRCSLRVHSYSTSGAKDTILA